MKAPYIKTHIENKRYAKEGTININFDEWKKDTILLEMEIIRENILKGETFVYWEIFSNGVQLDIGDLTTGQKVELILLKSYAGPPTSPHKFTIRVKDKDKKIITSLEINVFCTPRITKVGWYSWFSQSEVSKAYLNTNIDLLVEGQGYYGIPLTLKIHELETEDVIDGPHTINLVNLYDKQHFYFEEKNSIPATIFFTLFSFLLEKRIYPTLWVGDTLLFDGKKNSVILELSYNYARNEDKDDAKGITIVVLKHEEYFTQKYEPCKYEKIIVSHGKQSKIAFDEKEIKKEYSEKCEITIIAGDNKEQPPVEILLSKLDTTHCQYNEDNKSYRIPYKDKQREEECKDHTGNVFVVDSLYEHGIFEFEKSDSRLSFVPRYPYKKDSLLDFLTQYMWAENYNIQIPINTCRYQKKLNIHIYPDALWTVHLKYGKTPDYFYKNEKLRLVTGFKESLDEVSSYLYPILRLIPGLHLTPLILEYLAMEAETVSLGFHARYNKNTETIDYTNDYRFLTEYIILQMVSLQLAVEVLLAILTYGESVAIKLPKIAKKIGKVARKVSKYIDKLEELGFTLHYPAIACYYASYYELQSDYRTALVTEMGIKADPLIGISYEKTLTLQEVYNNRQKVRQNTGKSNTQYDAFTEIIKEANVNAKLYIKIHGIISQEYTAKFNELTEKVTLLDRVGNYFMYNEHTIAQKDAISINIIVNGDAHLKLKKIVSTELKLNGNAKGAISHRRAFGKDEKGIWTQDIIELSEVKGTYMSRMTGKLYGILSYDSNPEETPKPFVAFDKQTLGFKKIYIIKTK